MPDLDTLREITGRLQPPAFDTLVTVSRQRRRRATLGGALGFSAVVIAASVAVSGLSSDRRSIDPADPTPTPSPSASTLWTPERFKAEGESEVLVPLTETGLMATQYVACSGTCEGEISNRGLEVSQNGQSAVFEVRGLAVSFSPVWVEVFDGDSVLVQDAVEVGRPDGAVRFRLLQADGTEVELEVVEEPVPAAPGTDVFVIDPYDAWSRGSRGPDDVQRLYRVDDDARTLRPLDVPRAITQWGPEVDRFLWGTDGCRVFWQRTDGSFDHHDTTCRDPGLTNPANQWWPYLGDWAEPGRMVVVEVHPDGYPLVLHASPDRGSSWERVTIDRLGDVPLTQSADAILDALGPPG
jgi:hypothetical protein